ncbi:MAG: LPS export ABC transporter permease LptG [Gammaproteobacteria bacterium]|nr:LPS export ABC transporter permease LptG [Gammaproteobacteria bacterium]
MKIIQRYFTTTLVSYSMLALSVLVALFCFFSLIDQLEETGKGSYGVTQAITYVILTVPRLSYELFLIGAVIGSMTSLGIMAQHSELAVIRTAGVSKLKLSLILIKSGLLLVLIALFIGEVLAPICEEKAQHMRSMALTDQIALKTKFGFWARDANSYINIRKVLPDGKVEEVYIYEFDENDELRSSIHAESGEYGDGKWLLENISQSTISKESVSSQHIELASWDSLLEPEMFNLLIVNPEYLTFLGLLNYIEFLKQNAQDSQRYEQALWAKLVRPLSILAMIVLAVPLVRGTARTTAVGQRVFIGALIGIVFHIINQMSSHLGVVYNIPAIFSVTVPTIILSALTLYMLQRQGT